MTFERYAIYWTPRPDSPLCLLEKDWFGGNWIKSGCFDTAPWHDAGLAVRAVASPRRYGLHATMKAPFRLAPNTQPAALSESLAVFCARRRRVISGPLRLHRFTRYLALIPAVPRADLEWLADDCVTHFDRFRAPLSDAERARRGTHISQLEQSHFEQFGYPYIFSKFFFHITLAGPLDEDELDHVEKALKPRIAPFCGEHFVIDALSLCADPGNGKAFQCLDRFPLMP